MPIYQYQGKHYDLSETDPAAAKAKILNYLGSQEPAAPAAATAAPAAATPAAPAIAKPAAPIVPDTNTFAGLDVPVATPEAPSVMNVPAKTAGVPEDPMLNPRFITSVQAQLDSLPADQRAAALEKIKQSPDAYGRAARVIEQRYAKLNAAPETIQKATDTRLEAQRRRFIKQGLRPEFAESYAQTQALSGTVFPDLQQMEADVVGEKAAAEAQKRAEELENAGFWERVGAGAASQYAKSGLGLAQATADLLGDRETSVRLGNARRIEGAREQAIPKGNTIFERSAQHAMTSLAVQAPTIALGALTGTAGPVLAQAALQQFGDSYGEGRASGLSGTVAATRAVPMAAAEVFFERFGMTKALAGLKGFVAKNGVDGIPEYVAKSIASEIPSEMATTLTQYGIDALPGIGTKGNPSLVDLYKELEETLRQTVLQAGVTTATVSGGAKAAQTAEKLFESKGYKPDTSYQGMSRLMLERAGFARPEGEEAEPPLKRKTVATPATIPTVVGAPAAEQPAATAPAAVKEPEAVPGMVTTADLFAEPTGAPAAAAPAAPAEAKPLEVFKNPTENMQSRIVQLQDGRYSVTLQDLDSGETLPNARIFPKLESAQQYARRIANLPAEAPAAAAPAAAPVVPKKAPILQNRDRSGAASIAQMRSIAAAPDYGRLGFSRDFVNGSPVIAGGQVPQEQLGKQDIAVAADGRRIPVQYAVVDADSVLASNSVDGSVNPEYDNQEVIAPRAIAGNGRIAGLQEAYKTGTATQYKTELTEDQLHGISPDVVARIPKPVLVRVMPESEVTANIGDVSNIGGGLDLSPLEQAKNDLNRFDFDQLTFNESGSLTPESVIAFIKKMPLQEQGKLVDGKGKPLKQAYDRLEAAIFAKAYNNNELIDLFAQAHDAEGRLVISALAQVAPYMAKLEGAGALDIRDIVVDAATTIINAKIKGIALKDAVQQMDITVAPDARIIVALFAANPRSNKAAIEALRNAAEFAYAEASKPTEDMFGAVAKAERGEVLKKLEARNEPAVEENVAEANRPRRAAPVPEGKKAEPSAGEVAAGAEAGRAAEEFTLTGETEEERRAREAAAPEKQRKAEEKALADREREVFQLQGQRQEPEAPTDQDMFSQRMARTTDETTDEDRKMALHQAELVGGTVVFQKGAYALVRGYEKRTGRPFYVPTVGNARARVEIDKFTGNQIPDSIKKQMLATKKRLEKESQEAFEKNPFIIFDNGIALSQSIPEDLAGVIRGWKNLLVPNTKIYVSTIEDANANKNKFNGPHRVIGSGTLDSRNAGSMRQMEDGSYYILFTKSTSKTNMLEIIAHELGHVHQFEYFDKATPEEKSALLEAHAQWLKRQKGQTAKALIESLRAHTTGKTTTIPAGQMAAELTPYWSLFKEWYADQTARWAVSAKTPTNIVEKFFKRLGVALRKFYQSLKAQKYLPDETFVQYIEKVTSRPIEINPETMPTLQQGFDFFEESQMTKEIADANPDSRSLHAAAELPGAKKKLPPGRSPELAAAAKMVQEGTMTAAEFDKLVNQYKPIYVYEAPLKPATEAQMVDALDSAKRDKVNPDVPNGRPVGLRLDIPAFNRKGVYVVTIHEKGTKSGPGKAIGYSSVAKVTNATFGLGNQKAALKIATGEAKDALQTVEGTYVKVTPEEASAQAQQVLDDPSWTQIGLDPTRHAYFYDRYTSIPVIAAEEILQIGNMVLGKNVTYGKKADFLYNIDATPKQTKEQRTTARKQMRNEKIQEFARLRLREFHLYKRMRDYGSTIERQRLANELNGLTQALKSDIDLLKTPLVTPENFLNQARNALEGNLPYREQSISPEVFAVIRDAYQKMPWLLSGLRLSIKTAKYGERASGNFAPMTRIVTLWNGSSGTENPTTIRHELTHSMEQMMTPAQQKVLIEAWRDALGAAINKHTDAESQKYFVKVLEFLNQPSEQSFQDALDALPSYELYQYINPSEFWAVNAEKLLAKQLGGAWAKFKKAMIRLFEGLKNIFGFNNQYAVHKVFEDIVKGQNQRISRSSLADIVVGSGYSMDKLENLGDDERMLRKYNRPNTPQLDTSPMLTAITRAGRYTKDLFKDAVMHPLAASEMMMNNTLRGITYIRNKNVWFGSGLNAADFKRYNGALRTSEGFATASVAIDNAIRGAQLSVEVIFRGGIKYDSKTLTFNAVKTEKGMAGVYKAEMKLKKVLGNQVGTDLIQAYLEAKRSRSIQNEAFKRTQQFEDLKDELAKLKAQASPDPKEVKRVTAELEDAKTDLDAIKVAYSKINMSDEEIAEFISRDKVHTELRDIMDNWTAVNQNMLKFWRQVGLLSEGRYKVLSSIEDYVPWNRIMDDSEDIHSPLQSTTRKMTNIGLEKLFKRGKPKVITDFVAEPGQQTFKIQPASVISAKINGTEVPSDKMEITPTGEVKINLPIKAGDLVVFNTNREIENMIDNMTRNVMRMTMNGLRQYAAMRIVKDYATREPNGNLMVAPKVEQAKGRFNFIANGKRIVVEIQDPLIAEAIFGMETLGLKTVPILAAVANLTRRTITLSGAFQLKQVFKDAPTAALVTGVKNPALLLGGVYKGFLTSLTKTDPAVEILHAAGITGFRSPTRTPEAEIKQRLGIMNRNVASFVIRGLDHIGDASDMAQRVATYKRVLAETGDEAQALYQAANVINFNRHGSGQIAQFLVKTAPFMGAWANSTDVLFQALAGGGLKGISRSKALQRLAITGTLMVSATLIYCMLVGDDDEYNQLDDQTKLRNFMIPGTKIMLPMNTSAAYFFKAIPEMIYNKVMKEGTQTPVDNRRLRRALAEAARDMLLGPEPIPAAGKPFIEIGLNHSFFTGREITPAAMKDLEPAEQYTMTTSEFGKMISALTGTEKNRLLNPIEADHLVRSIFGSAGAMAQWASNVMGQAAGVRPDVQAKEYPLIGAFLRPEVPRGREDLFYDLKGEIDQAYKTMTIKAERLKDEELDKYLNANEDLIAMHDYVNEVDNAFKEINQAIRFYGTAVDKTITPSERRKEINDLQKIRGEILEGIEQIRRQAGM